jgi:nicotinate-nucleotide pyrophosphorylase (carboxylating)
LTRQLQAWLAEDLGRGDLTRPALMEREGQAEWIAKRDGVFCGGVLVEPLFRLLDPRVWVEGLVPDGERVRAGQRLLSVAGPAAALVAGERTALNLAMRLSGVATATAALVAELEGTGAQLVDTRKTTPGLRVWEKYAVRCGGGVNHRFGLDDAAMLKENHLAWGGGIGPAVAAVRASAPWPTKVIVEAETEEEARAALRAGADGVLLDGFSPEDLQLLVPRLRQLSAELSAACGEASSEAFGEASSEVFSEDRRPRCAWAGGGARAVLEASGVAPEALRATAVSGVDLISTSAPITRGGWLDISMRFVPQIA